MSTRQQYNEWPSTLGHPKLIMQTEATLADCNIAVSTAYTKEVCKSVAESDVILLHYKVIWSKDLAIKLLLRHIG